MVYYVKTLSDTDCSYRFRIPTDMYTTFLRPRFNAEQIQIANNGGIFPITALCIDSNNLYNLTCRCSARQNRVTERYFEGQWLLYSAERNLQAGFRLLFGWSVGLFRLKIRVIPDASDPQLGLLSVLRFWDQFHGCFLPRIPRITGANGVNVEHATGVSISVVLRMLEHGDRLELVDPSYRPSLASVGDKGPVALPVAGSDLVISPAQWSSHVVGKISSWIDLDSDDEVLRRDSETILKQELAWASHLSLQACLLPPPKGTSCANYARCVNQILQSSTNNLQLWLKIPLRKHEDGDPIDDEPLSFPTNARGYLCLSTRHQKLVTAFFNHSVQVDSAYRPSLANVGDKGPMALPVAALDLVRSHVVGVSISFPLRKLEHGDPLELACLLPPPKGTSCANYARCVNQILQSSTNNLQLWLKIPLRKHEDGDPIDDEPLGGDPVDSWETWNSFRHLCEHSNQLSIALDVLSSLSSSNLPVRWFGEPLRAAILHSGVDPAYRPSLANVGDKGPVALPVAGSYLVLSPAQLSLSNHVVGNKMDPLPEQEQDEVGLVTEISCSPLAVPKGSQ